MADLTTSWLGLDLASPFIVGASPLADDLDALQGLAAAGAGAVVLRSVFEEQIVAAGFSRQPRKLVAAG